MRVAILLLALAWIPAAHAGDSSFECADNQEVRPGDSTSTVIDRCGQPTSLTQHVEQRPAPPTPDEAARQTACEDQMRELWQHEKHGGSAPDLTVCAATPQTRSVAVEVWTYDLGPNRFVRTLRFEDGVLVNIHAGFYGKG
jgi:hypothetical protein